MSSICVVCDQAITGQILSALGKTYHPEHFTCTKCKEPIKDSKFQEHDGLPYCDEDYTQMFSKRCFACKQPIKDKIIKALGVEWHEEHFVCTVCRSSLCGSSFLEKDGFPYCTKDYYSKFGEKCAGCGEPLTEEATIALDKKWHPSCFVCEKCKQTITEESFTLQGGKPHCAKCS
ncbi:hypothetical protein FQR65_LT13588 [Abscondita terminalis]|nr:hypothetical protein FQR65_LT13588 [Abscondita terminalis]